MNKLEKAEILMVIIEALQDKAEELLKELHST